MLHLRGFRFLLFAQPDFANATSCCVGCDCQKCSLDCIETQIRIQQEGCSASTDGSYIPQMLVVMVVQLSLTCLQSLHVAAIHAPSQQQRIIPSTMEMIIAKTAKSCCHLDGISKIPFPVLLEDLHAHRQTLRGNMPDWPLPISYLYQFVFLHMTAYECILMHQATQATSSPAYA